CRCSPRPSFSPYTPLFRSLLRIDARGRIARDVADVVRAGAARGQPRLGDSLEHGERALRRDLPDLQVGARGDVRIAAAELLGDRSEEHTSELQSPCNLVCR